jgi:hypothetical protein
MKINGQIICSFIFTAFLVMITGTASASDVNLEKWDILGEKILLLLFDLTKTV